jgi:hypothetical protein
VFERAGVLCFYWLEDYLLPEVPRVVRPELPETPGGGSQECPGE